LYKLIFDDLKNGNMRIVIVSPILHLICILLLGYYAKRPGKFMVIY